MPASHDRMTTAVRSASGPPPVSHGRTTSHCSTGDRAKPASHSLRRQSGRPVVGRIAGPYRHCHAVGRTRAGHVHAGRIADGVNSRGAALCASRLAPCGVSWASTRCRIASGARPRRHGDTGPSAATHHQPPSLGRPSPTLLPSAGARPFKLGAGAPVGPARAYHHSGRPSRPAHATRQRRGGASARPPRLTRPLARSPRHAVPANVTRRRLGRAGPTGPRRAGRAPQATRTHLRRHGPPGTGRPRSSWDSDARDRGPPAPRHQVATHDIARAMSRHRPSAFGRDPDPRARFPPLKIPAPVTFSAAASPSCALHGSFPLATARPVNRTRIFQCLKCLLGPLYKFYLASYIFPANSWIPPRFSEAELS